jgi:flagellar biosynthesis protein FliR
MLSKGVKLFTGLVGVLLLCVFIIGLAHSISIGFAGFWGGLPFVVIITFVLLMAIYDYWDECVRNKDT